MPNTLGDSAAHLQNTANMRAASADQSASVAAGSEEASANVQAVAATEQLTSSVRQIGRRISEPGGITGKAVVDSTDHTATRMFAAADEISGQSDLLRTSVAGFFAAIGTS